MIRAVIDTNVLVSGLISPKASPAKIVSLWHKRKFILVISPEILEEVKKVLSYSKICIKYHLDKHYILKYLKTLETFSELVDPESKIEVIKADKSDNKFIEVAVDSGSNYLVSGDKHLLELKKYRNIKIISVSDFLNKF